MLTLYCYPRQDDRIFNCLLTSMAALQAEDVRASYVSVGVCVAVACYLWFAVVAPTCNSPYPLTAIILMVQAVPNLRVSRKIFLKHHVNWNTDSGAIEDLPWHMI